MPKSVKATVKGAVLAWARDSAGLSQEEAAKKANVNVDKLRAWEANDDAPSIPQLRRLSKAYKRPLAVFYLQEVPRGFDILRDLRRLPGVGFRRLPPIVVQETRYAMQRRELALELVTDLGEELKRFTLRADINEDPEFVGARVREALQVTNELQSTWRDAEGRVAFNQWRQRIEALGVLIFQATQIESAEASGFAIYNDVFPVIVVNRKDAPVRRTFSLLHELAHLMLRLSGVSDLETDERRPPEDQQIEVFSNKVAAASLIPADTLRNAQVVLQYEDHFEGWSDAEISVLASNFGVSREALLRRLLQLQKTTDAFYRAKRQQYIDEYMAGKEAKREKAAEREIRRNMPQETLSNLGRPLVNAVISNYHQDNLTLSDVAGLLGVKTKHIPRIEQKMRGEPADGTPGV